MGQTEYLVVEKLGDAAAAERLDPPGYRVRRGTFRIFPRFMGVRPVVDLTFAATAFSVREARQRLAHELERAKVPPTVRADALLLASELLNNAIQHGSREGDQLELRCLLDADKLVLEVVDSARHGGTPTALTPDEQRSSGRGLQIVERLAESWRERIVNGHREVSLLLHLGTRP